MFELVSKFTPSGDQHLAHNKTLAGQLYSEFKELFPNNKVEYFVS